MEALLTLVGVLAAGVLVFCVYSTVLYAVEAAKYPKRIQQLEFEPSSKRRELPVIPPVDWLDKEESLQNIQTRSLYFAECMAAAVALRDGAQIKAPLARKWRTSRDEFFDIVRTEGTLEPLAAESLWNRTASIKPLAVSCVTLALEAIAAGEDEEALTWIKCSFELAGLALRGNLWVHILFDCGIYASIQRPLAVIMEHRRHNREFLESLLVLLTPADPFEEFRVGQQAELQFCHIEEGRVWKELFKWHPYSHLLTFLSKNFASVFIGRYRVSNAFVSASMTGSWRSLRFKFVPGETGQQAYDRMLRECAHIVPMAFRTTNVSLPSTAAAVFLACVKKATGLNLLRTAIHRYLNGRTSVAELDWFILEPLKLKVGVGEFTVISAGHGESAFPNFSVSGLKGDGLNLTFKNH